jgi:hypothetical protein
MKGYKSQQRYTKGIGLNDGYTIETEEKGNGQKANPRGTDYHPLTYLAYFRSHHEITQ